MKTMKLQTVAEGFKAYQAIKAQEETLRIAMSGHDACYRRPTITFTFCDEDRRGVLECEFTPIAWGGYWYAHYRTRGYNPSEALEIAKRWFK